MPYEATIGLELHARIRALTKIFSLAPASFNAPVNSNVSLFDAAMPGTLPRLNITCVHIALKAAAALKMCINRRSTFDRKHYFYADIPLGYQITQYHNPLARGGVLNMDTLDGLDEPSHVRIKQLHLEQDTAASHHDLHPTHTLVDLNRVGIGLMEIVTEPDMHTAKEAAVFVRKVQHLLRAVGASDGNMQEGSLRCDVNVSVRRSVGGGEGSSNSSSDLGVRCEIKNLNSLKSLQSSIEFEVQRHMSILDNGGIVLSETRGYDVEKGSTFLLRSKEDTPDYRYMPDGDLPPLVISQRFLDRVRDGLPEMPEATRDRLIASGISVKDVHTIMSHPNLLLLYDEATKLLDGVDHAKKVSNWIAHDLSGLLHVKGTDFKHTVLAQQIAGIVQAIEQRTITGSGAKVVLQHIVMQNDERPINEIITEFGLSAMSDDQMLQMMCEDIVDAYPKQAQSVRDGNPKVLQFLIGKVMQKSRGRADATKVKVILQSLLV